MKAICAIVASLLLAGTVFADTINVPADYPTIQGAIDAASNGDVIQIAVGTYNEHSLNPNGKAITIQGTLNEDGSLATTIDAQQSGTVFTINSEEGNGTVIQNLSITGGMGVSIDGGGIHCFQSSPTIADCRIEGNLASGSGGGIFCWDHAPIISGCIISGNVATSQGGGIGLVNANPIISGCTIKDNTADSIGGGGISCYYDSSPTINNCTISGNTSHLAFGGGILFQHFSSPIISDCTIKDNTAIGGGGIAFSQTASPTITNCTISNNAATFAGGGILFTSFVLHLSNTIVCGNAPDQITGSLTDNGGNTIEDECPLCPGDATGDGYVDVNDVLYVIANWDMPDPNADFDEDSLVDADDVLILLSNFGESCS